MSNYLFINQEKSAEMLVPIIPVDYNLQAQNDRLIYVPLATRNNFGIVKIGEGLLIEHGLLSFNRTELDVKLSTNVGSENAGKFLYVSDTGNIVFVDQVQTITKISELENDVGFITNTVDNLVNYYLKTEQYTKEEINELVSRIPKFDIEVVEDPDTIPEEERSETTIYLVPRTDGELNDYYEEIIWIHNTWERLGSTKINLSNYYTKTDADMLFLSKTDANSTFAKIIDIPDVSNFATKDELPNLDDFDLSEYAKKTDIPDISNLANRADIPTKISELDNDRGFLDSIPSEYITESVLNLKNYATKGEIPTSLSQLSNDEGFIKNTVDNLTNYYLKTQLYTKDEVNTLINNISTFNAKIVDELPTTNISPTTIYLISKTDSIDKDYYDEYLYINYHWEMIGHTYVDLWNYYSKEVADSIFVKYGDLPTNHVTTDTQQTITAQKRFNKILVKEYYGENGSLIAKDNTDNSVELGDYRYDLDILSKTRPKISIQDELVYDEIALKSEIPTDYAKLSDIPDVSEFITQTTLDNNYFTSSEVLEQISTEISKIRIPTKLSELDSDTNNQRVSYAEKTAWNNKSDFDGEYSSLSGKPDLSSYLTASSTTNITGSKTFIGSALQLAPVSGAQPTYISVGENHDTFSIRGVHNFIYLDDSETYPVIELLGYEVLADTWGPQTMNGLKTFYNQGEGALRINTYNNIGVEFGGYGRNAASVMIPAMTVYKHDGTTVSLNIPADKNGTIALLDDIPDVSQFITKNVNDLTNYYTQTYIATNFAAKNEIPDTSGFITNTVNNLLNYYLKSETYTKEEVNAIFNSIKSFNAEIVTELPTSNISTTTIYLVAKTDTENNDYYDEYLYINNVWEMIGNTKIDLTNYYTKDEAINLFAKQSDLNSTNANVSQNTTNISNRYTKAEVNNLIKDFITKEVNNLTNYYTSAQIDAKGYLTSIPSNYVTEHELGVRLNDYATDAYVDNAFTLINDLRTDLTSLEETVEGLAGSSDLSDRVSTLETNQELINAEVVEHDEQIIDLQNNKVPVSAWADLSTNVSTLYDRVSALQNTVNNIPTKTSQLTNDSGYVTSTQHAELVYTVSTVLANTVKTTNTAQEIAGIKTFTDTIIVPDVTIS